MFDISKKVWIPTYLKLHIQKVIIKIGLYVVIIQNRFQYTQEINKLYGIYMLEYLTLNDSLRLQI